MPNLKILVIESDPFYRTYVNDLLTETGAEILDAFDGQAALALARSQVPDVILCDVESAGAEGPDLPGRLKDDPDLRGIPVITMSGGADGAAAGGQAGPGARSGENLRKPFTSQDLFAAIRSALGDRGAALEAPEVVKEADRPDTQSPEAPIGTGGAATVDRPAGGKALVVDDSRYVLDVAGDFLREMGVSVVTAMDGEEALEAVSRHRPDIVLLDVQIPRLSGFVVCERLKRDPATAGVPVVLMSAVVDAQTFERHSRLRYRADAYLPKPFMKKELQGIAARLLALEPACRPGALPDAPSEPSAGPSATNAPSGDIALELESARERERRLLAQRKGLEEQVRSLGERLAASSENGATREEAVARVRELESQLGRRDAEMDELARRLGKERDAALNEAEGRAAAVEAARKALAEGTEGWRTREEAMRTETERIARECKARGDEAQARAEALEGEVRRLELDLKAAVSAKAEIEEQAKSLLASSVAAGEKAVRSQLEQARSENHSLARRLSEAQAGLARIDELGASLERFKEENGVLGGEVRRLEALMEGARRESTRAASELVKERARALDLEGALKAEEERSSKAQEEARASRRRLEEALGEAAAERQRTTAAQERCTRLESGLEEARRQEAASSASVGEAERLRTECARLEVRNEELEARLRDLTADLQDSQEVAARGRAGREEDGATLRSLAERLGSVETLLDRTVREAQSALMEQRDREASLEQQLKGMAAAMEEERADHRRSMDRWKARDAEQRSAIAQAQEDRVRRLGEEITRYLPVAMAREARPLAMVRPWRGVLWAVAALAAALLLAAAFLLGRYGIDPPGSRSTGVLPQRGSHAGWTGALVSPCGHKGPDGTTA